MAPKHRDFILKMIVITNLGLAGLAWGYVAGLQIALAQKNGANEHEHSQK